MSQFSFCRSLVFNLLNKTAKYFFSAKKLKLTNPSHEGVGHEADEKCDPFWERKFIQKSTDQAIMKKF